MCSERIRSTVTLNAGSDWPVWGVISGVNGPVDGDDGDENDEDLRIGELGEVSDDLLKIPFVDGVMVPEPLKNLCRCRASEAALRRRLVVPRAFAVPDRAEQTIAIFCLPI
jgi:hypothetical protein